MGNRSVLEGFAFFLNMVKKNLLLGLYELLSYNKMVQSHGGCFSPQVSK